MKTAEEMRERVLALIQGWLTNSNAKDNEQCVMLLNALAGDVQIISVEPVSSKAAEAPGGQDADPVMRCSKCKGTLIYKRTDEGFVIFEDSCGRKAIAPSAPSERARFVEWYAKWPKGRPTSDGLTVPEIIEAAEAYAEYALAGLSSQEGK